MQSLESRTNRYRKAARLLCFNVALQGKILRTKPPSPFQRRKIEELMQCIYSFRRLTPLNPLPSQMAGGKKKLSFWV